MRQAISHSTRRIAAVILCIICTGCCHAQYMRNFLNEKQFMANINLVDEFRARFNGEKDSPATDKTDPDYATKRLLYMFNGKMFKSFSDPLFIQAQAFADTVVKCGTRLNFHDNTWVAKAKCHGKLKGRDTDFTLYLTVESRGQDMYKWVISRAEGTIFKLKPSRQTDKTMIMPDDHETNFMSLNHITAQKADCITGYSRKGFTPDETTAFFAMVNYGLLSVEYVADLEFIFMQVPGYTFSVNYFERDSNNAGWLISSFHKAPDKEKEDFLNSIYLNNNSPETIAAAENKD